MNFFTKNLNRKKIIKFSFLLFFRGWGGGRGAGVSKFFYYEPKFNIFFFRGGGVRARISELFLQRI